MMRSNQSAEANPAGALWLQAHPLADRVAEIGS